MHLAGYLDSTVVPDVYFRIGETIFHFLIDEFQDTSPIQWRNLFPLIENSLSQGGSLFTVGDTKQAIYGFRNADYAIMKGLERNNPFPSAEHSVRSWPPTRSRKDTGAQRESFQDRLKTLNTVKRVKEAGLRNMSRKQKKEEDGYVGSPSWREMTMNHVSV
jgi:hypothetical protein